MSNVLIGEFIGTMLLVLLGDGVCANVTLNNSGFKAAGPLFIALHNRSYYRNDYR